MKCKQILCGATIAIFLVALFCGPALAGDRGGVENATFTTKVVDDAPVDFLEEFPSTTPVVFYYCVIVGLPDQAVTHRWRHEGKVLQEIEIPVESDRQATWSKMDMTPRLTGVWSVDIVNGRGEVIETDTFAFEAPL